MAIEELHQRWLVSGAVEDGHSYVLALWEHQFLANHEPETMMSEMLTDVPTNGSREPTATYRLDNGEVFGAEIVAHQTQVGLAWYNLVELRLDGARYVFLPQRWARSPVRMARLRATTWPEHWQIGPDAYRHWLGKVQLAYGTSNDASMAQKPTGTSAIELDLGELLAPQWRYVLLAGDESQQRKLLGLFDLLLSARGTGGGSIDPPVSALHPSTLPDRVAPFVQTTGHGLGVQHAGETTMVGGWTYRHEPIDGRTGARETLSRVSLQLDPGRWMFEKRVLWENEALGDPL